MPPALPFIMAGAAVASVGLGVAANKQAKKGAKYQQEAYEAQVKQQELQAARQRRDLIRQGRMVASQAAVAAEGAGVSGSSVAVGAQGALRTSLSENLSFLDRYGMLSDTASTALGNANVANAKADNLRGWAGVAKTTVSGAGQLAGSESFNGMFGGKK